MWRLEVVENYPGFANATLTRKGIVQNVQVSFLLATSDYSHVTRIDIYLTYMASLISKLECIGKPLGQD